MRTFLVRLLAALCPFVAAAQGPPPGYYDSVDDSDAAILRVTLHEVIDDHTRLPYTSVSTDTWDVLELADEDPSDAGRIRTVYRDATFPKQGGGNPFYDREHSWPRSLGFPDDWVGNYPFTDCHMLFLADSTYNNARSNKPFRNCHPTCAEWTSTGGGSGAYPGQSNWTSGSLVAGTWEAWIGRRGDVARAILYADVRYEGGTHGVSGFAEPDLRVTNDQDLIAASQTGQNEQIAYMGILDVLVAWHHEDAPDEFERARNDTVFLFQGNRNPFVDHPEWVDVLYVDLDAPTADPWINELHYDNAGADVGELVEIAGPAGLDLTGFALLGQNGNGGGVYATLPLGGTIPDQGSCLGTLSFPFPGLQNGSPDGLVLTDRLNRAVQFLSYEGTFVATEGPATGTTSVDIGVSEGSGTPVGYSLQLAGSGSLASSFSWQPPQPESPDAPNAGQSFADGCSLLVPYGCGANPAGSLVGLAGAPALGTVVTLGVHNPLGTQAPGAASFLAVSAAPDAAFPCGTPVPGLGMAGSGAAGELLVSLAPPGPLLVAAGDAWSGEPAPFALAVPGDPALVGTSLFAQGLLLDATPSAAAPLALTEGVELWIGP